MAKERRFMDPHEVPPIPGTEGWEEMYPYYYMFGKGNTEREKYESSQLWFYDGVHYPFPMHPLDIIWDDMWHLTLSGFTSKVFCIPNSNGIDHRILNGYIYLSGTFPSKEEEARRLPLVQARTGHYYEKYEELYELWKTKMMAVIDEMKEIHFPSSLPTEAADSYVYEHKGYFEADEILRNYDRIIELSQRSWQIHMELDGLAYGAFVNFIYTMRDLFPGITDKAITQMTTGFTGDMFRPPAELQKLAKLALELEVADTIKAEDKWTDMATKLQQSDVGQKWLAAVEEVREPWFEMSIGGGWHHMDVAWNDHLDVPLAHIKNYILRLEKGEQIDKPVEEVEKEKQRVISEYRSLTTSEEDRKVFDERLKLAQLVAIFPEDHQFYIENWFHALFYRRAKELGQMFVSRGVLQDKEDIFYLDRFEIYPILYDVLASWATGVPAIAKYELPSKIERRKQIYDKFKEWAPPPALGVAPEVVTEPNQIVLWGVTSEKIDLWLEAADIKPEEVTELKGFAASAGVKEGTARVCMELEDIAKLREGDILVGRMTAASWAPVFNIIAGCVTDIGGTFCHAAIVAREYKMPAVVGVGNGTAIIKSGDKLRIDGDNGVVTILERA
ncbi:MAG: PEP-utilizing enzyme, mobile region [Desulfobacteraceae bacterium]|nr:PEP-utilizing enzyme, mobile region [Desulfobacteraceae bacterium]